MTVRFLPEHYQQRFLKADNYPAMRELAKKGPIPLRALVAVPLFSLRTADCIGGGEFPELPRFAGWAARAGFSGMLALPFTSCSNYDSSGSPYNADSLGGLDPARIRLSEVREVVRSKHARAGLASLAETIVRLNAAERVDNQGIRQVKEAVLRAAFEELDGGDKMEVGRCREFEVYCLENRDWLDEHANFRVLVDRAKGTYWGDWEQDFQDPHSRAVSDFLDKPESRREIKFQKFVQWLADEQLTKYAQECAGLGVPLFGDLIFAPSRQSSDYYYHRIYYLHGRFVGAPPDGEADDAQGWGMPAVDPRRFEADPSLLLQPALLMRRRGMKGIRVDHGNGRINPYLIREGCSARCGERLFQGLPAEYLAYGKTFFQGVMGTGLEVFAENLGEQLSGVAGLIDQLGIGEMGVFRWDRKAKYDFMAPGEYPALSVKCSSTHDTTTLAQHLIDLHDPSHAQYPNGAAYSRKEKSDLWSEAGALVRYLHWDKLPSLNDDLYRDVVRSLAFGPQHQVIVPLADVMACHGAYRDQRLWLINRQGVVNSPEYNYNWNFIFPDLPELYAGATARMQFIGNYFFDLWTDSGRF